MRHTIRPTAALLAALVLACAPNDAGQPAAKASTEPNVVTITATEYAFHMPAQVPAGPTKFVLKSAGKEIHHAVLARLDGGKTLKDVGDAFKSPGPPPAWIHFESGPNPPNPGAESNATVVLKPGTYAVLCFIPSEDGVAHFAKGMATTFEVTDSPAAGNSAPEPDVVVRMTEYAYTLSTPLTAGTHTIRMINDGHQQHEVALFKFAPGKSTADVVAWDAGGAKGPPPGSLLGGTSPMDPGASADFTVTLDAGDYGLICFVPDAGDGKGHLTHGMAQAVKVS